MAHSVSEHIGAYHVVSRLFSSLAYALALILDLYRTWLSKAARIGKGSLNALSLSRLICERKIFPVRQNHLPQRAVDDFLFLESFLSSGGVCSVPVLKAYAQAHHDTKRRAD